MRLVWEEMDVWAPRMDWFMRVEGAREVCGPMRAGPRRIVDLSCQLCAAYAKSDLICLLYRRRCRRTREQDYSQCQLDVIPSDIDIP